MTVLGHLIISQCDLLFSGLTGKQSLAKTRAKSSAKRDTSTEIWNIKCVCAVPYAIHCSNHRK